MGRGRGARIISATQVTGEVDTAILCGAAGEGLLRSALQWLVGVGKHESIMCNGAAVRATLRERV